MYGLYSGATRCMDCIVAPSDVCIVAPPDVWTGQWRHQMYGLDSGTTRCMDWTVAPPDVWTGQWHHQMLSVQSRDLRCFCILKGRLARQLDFTLLCLFYEVSYCSYIYTYFPRKFWPTDFKMKDLECIPFGIAQPLREAIHECFVNPPPNLPTDAYQLIGMSITSTLRYDTAITCQQMLIN